MDVHLRSVLACDHKETTSVNVTRYQNPTKLWEKEREYVYFHMLKSAVVPPTLRREFLIMFKHR